MRLFLRKKEILTSVNEIDNLFNEGITLNGFLFDIIYQPGTKTKVLFAVSKQVKGHIKKNRIKRKLREVYRLNKNTVPQNFNYAIIGKKEAAEAKIQFLKDEFKNCLGKIE